MADMSKNSTYDVFVSHNRNDKAWVRRFVIILKNLGIQTFYDEDDIKVGEDIARKVMHGLENSRRSVLIISPESLKSKWVAAECLARLYDDPDGRDQSVLPILLSPVDIKQIPLFLRGKLYADLTNHSRRKIVWENLLRQLGATARVLPEMPDPNFKERYPRTNTKKKAASVKSYSSTPPESQRKVAIIGMGYVGTLLASALANAGHSVIGVERDPSKFDRLLRGDSHLLEPGMDQLLRNAHLSNRLTITHSFEAENATNSEFAVVCVGPFKRNDGGKEDWDISRFKRVLEEIGEAIKKRKSLTPLNIIIAATVRPQDCEQKLIEEYLNESNGTRYLIATNPLFFREGSMLDDLRNPPFIITGTFDGKPNIASKDWGEIMLNLTQSTTEAQFQLFSMTMAMASMVKLSSNAFHAMKVCFANEIGRICHERDIDAGAMMNIFKRDHTLNISNLYLEPGFAFGGSCLGKDIFGLLSTANKHTKDTFRLIGSIQDSNKEHIKQAVQTIKDRAESIGQNCIGFFGLTFKPGTDDIRSSPAIELINQLPRQYEILAIDSDLQHTPDLTGKNRSQWIDVLQNSKITIANDIKEIVSNSRILVIAKPSGVNFEELLPLLSDQHFVVDLIGEFSKSKLRDFPSTYGLV
jgi:GDP-mannose 6-dehydrogenase